MGTRRLIGCIGESLVVVYKSQGNQQLISVCDASASDELLQPLLQIPIEAALYLTASVIHEPSEILMVFDQRKIVSLQLAVVDNHVTLRSMTQVELPLSPNQQGNMQFGCFCTHDLSGRPRAPGDALIVMHEANDVSLYQSSNGRLLAWLPNVGTTGTYALSFGTQFAVAASMDTVQVVRFDPAALAVDISLWRSGSVSSELLGARWTRDEGSTRCVSLNVQANASHAAAALAKFDPYARGSGPPATALHFVRLADCESPCVAMIWSTKCVPPEQKGGSQTGFGSTWSSHVHIIDLTTGALRSIVSSAPAVQVGLIARRGNAVGAPNAFVSVDRERTSLNCWSFSDATTVDVGQTVHTADQTVGSVAASSTSDSVFTMNYTLIKWWRSPARAKPTASTTRREDAAMNALRLHAERLQRFQDEEAKIGIATADAPVSDLLRQWSLLITLRRSWKEADRVPVQRDGFMQPGASDEDIQALQAAVGGLPLPPSYVQFLKLSNGWTSDERDGPDVLPAVGIHSVTSICIILLWLCRNVWSHTFALCFPLKWNGAQKQVVVFGTLAAEARPWIPVYEEIGDTLLVGRPYDIVALLNPAVIDPVTGEWEAWKLASWIPGVVRFASFRELVQEIYSRYVKYQQPYD